MADSGVVVKGGWNHKRGDGKEDSRYRGGKTEKDHKSGAWASRLKNQSARNEWCQNNKAVNSKHPSGNR